MFSSNTSQVSSAANYIEDVFSTYLYTGNGSTQTITNGIDLSTYGGLVWLKNRQTANTYHTLYDTARGTEKYLCSNDTTEQQTYLNNGVTAFNSDGFVIKGTSNWFNQSGQSIASWTFRKQPKFFDVVTYTGNGVAGHQIAHSLGSVPGCIIVKRLDISDDWFVYHRSVGPTKVLILNSTMASVTANRWNDTDPTSTNFTLGPDSSVNGNGSTYVAYLFAHDAGGFGLTGTDNVISCGSYTGNGLTTGNSITLGYEPQWLLVKRSDTSGYDWMLMDTMRGQSYTANNYLNPNLSSAEQATGSNIPPTATGFNILTDTSSLNANGGTYIYIAIRRGPMKTPTSGTSVLGLNARSGSGANATVTGSAGVSDLAFIKNRGSTVAPFWASRLTGTGYLLSSTTNAEASAGTTILQANPWDVMDGVNVGTTSAFTNSSSATYINYLFRRAPGFFDEVCYTGTGATQNVTHNLTVVPEMMIVKDRTQAAAFGWGVYHKDVGNTKLLFLNDTLAATVESTAWNNTTPTASVFTVGSTYSESTAYKYVAYLFATIAGVSKVGSYTGAGFGTAQTINCGFTGGARFVLIKCSSAVGGWYIYDSARGITSGNDPYFFANSSNAEVTGTNYIDSDSTGFKLTTSAPDNLNGTGQTFIFLAIA